MKVLIIGYPKSGKTTLFNELSKQEKYKNHFLLQTDDYMSYGFKQSLYKIIDVLKPQKNYLVEGVIGYRLLRKIAQLKLVDLEPNLIIVCKTDRPILGKHRSMCRALDTVWRGYTELEMDLPEIEEYWN